MDVINIKDIDNSIKKYSNGGIVGIMPEDVKNDLMEFEAALSDASSEEERLMLQEVIDRINLKYPTEYPQEEEINEIDKTDGSIKNMFGGNWYKENPSKLLGEIVVDTDRYGKEIQILKGDLSVLDKIDANDNFAQFEKDLNIGVSDIEPSVSKMLTKQQNEALVENIIKKSQADIGRKAVKKKVAQDEKYNDDFSVPTIKLQTYKDVSTLLNKDISQEELKAYVWYKQNIGQRLSNEWYELAFNDDDSRTNDQMINDWVNSGILFYSNGELQPKPIFASGDIYGKISRLVKGGDNSGQDIQPIISKYGEKVLKNHLEVLNTSFKRVYDKRLVITGNEEGNSLILKPISKFAREFQISSTESMQEFKWWAIGASKNPKYGEPDFNITSGSSYKQKTFETLSLTNAFCLWLVSNRNKIEVKGNITYADVIYFYIDGRTKQAPSSLSEQQAAAFKAQLQRTKSKSMGEGNRLFLKFLKDELTLNQKVTIEQTWNSQFNNYLAPNYNEIPVAFNVTKSFFDEEPFVIKQEKRDAVSFIFNEGSGCLAYDVGVGKTMSCLMIIEQFIVAGYSKRPFVVVPNQTYKQWLSEIKNLLPHRKVNGLYNLGVDYISEVQDENGDIMILDEGTITVMTYEGFSRLGFNEQTQNDIMSELYDILNQGGAEEQMSEKKKAGFYEKLETLVGRGLKGTNVEIESLGLDFVSFDEAHALKKVFTSVKGESEDGKKGKKQYSINSGLPSDTAIKGFMISQYILRNNNYRNVLLLTATPFTNSPLEVFSMLSLVAYHQLDKLGLKNINDFFDNYIDISTELVINHKLQPQYKQVVKGFNNLASLQRIILRFFDYKDGDDVNVPRPNKIVIPYTKKLVDGVVVKIDKDEEVTCNLQMSTIQQNMMDAIISYAEGKGEIEDYFQSEMDSDEEVVEEITDSAAENISESNLDKDEKAGVRALRTMNFSRNLALSPYLFEYSGLGQPTYMQYINTSPKLKYVVECIRSVKEYHEKHNEPVSGQVIYMDRGLKYFNLIKEYLINEVGFKRHEVGEITAKISLENKRKVQDSFLGRVYNEKIKDYESISDDQRVKVVIGSSSIKEGMNLQKKSTVLYNCFLDWNPTDVIQLQGRIWRQGNQYANIRIVNPLMIDSIDIFMFQKLEEKTARINTIWSNDGKSVLKLEELNPQEIKNQLIKDPVVLAKINAEILASTIIDDLSSEKAISERLSNYLLNVESINRYEKEISELVNDFSPSKSDLDIYAKITFLVNAFKQEFPKDEEGRVMLSDYERKYDMGKIKERIGDFEVSPKSKPYKPYWISIVIESKRQIEKDNKDLLEPRNIEQTPHGVLNYIDETKNKIEDLKRESEHLKSDTYIADEVLKIEQDRIANKFEIKPLEKVVEEFGRLNYLLSILRPKEPKKEVVTEYDSCEFYDEEGVRKIDNESIAKLTACVEALPQTKESHIDENGDYTPERLEVHKSIIDEIKGNVRCIDNGNQPIAILTGGSPASGKSSFLRHYAPFLLDTEILKIDADAIREKLPEYKGWNATATHNETKDIVNTILSNKEIGIPCKFDLIYDGTMNSTKNYLPLIGLLKRLGYKVFIVYMDNVPYNEVKERMLKRYQKGDEQGRGRFVPVSVIDDFFSKGKAALDDLKTKVDGYMVVDASTRDYHIIEEGGISLPKSRDYSMIGKPFTVKEVKEPIVEPIIEPIIEPVIVEEEVVITESKPSIEDLTKRLVIVNKMAIKNPALKGRVKIIEKMILKESNKPNTKEDIPTVSSIHDNSVIVKKGNAKGSYFIDNKDGIWKAFKHTGDVSLPMVIELKTSDWKAEIKNMFDSVEVLYEKEQTNDSRHIGVSEFNFEVNDDIKYVDSNGNTTYDVISDIYEDSDGVVVETKEGLVIKGGDLNQIQKFKDGGYIKPIRTIKFMVYEGKIVKVEVVSEIKSGNETNYFVKALSPENFRLSAKSNELFNTDIEAREYATKNKIFIQN